MKPVTNLKSIRGKNVLVRVDFNVPIERGKVADDTKIAATTPMVEWLLKRGAKVVLMTHFGRPKAGRESGIRSYELGVVIERLSGLLKKKVQMVQQWDFVEIGRAVKAMRAGGVLMLPNLRLHPGEEKNNPQFAQELASLASVYVNEAFSVCHRKHASVVGVPELLPSYVGLQLAKEIKILRSLISGPQHPLIVLMGGGKITDKIAMMQTMVKRADKVLVGGALATHFFKAMGYGVGASRVEAEGVRLAKKLIGHKKIVFPRDVVIGTTDGAGARVVEVPAKSKEQRAKSSKPYALCSTPYGIWDIGPQTILEYAQYIKDARTLIWNGPLGLYEVKPYCHGTLALGRLFAARSRGKAFGVIGGGETIDAMKKTGMAEYVDFISTGGGAMLEFLGGKKLPGIEALYGSK